MEELVEPTSSVAEKIDVRRKQRPRRFIDLAAAGRGDVALMARA
jgi:hypothetical protein